ncbi:hypothetical protein [Desulfoluna butyratoxydans]|nr:hypothetical protein [Desulfoluna butyratoxydans]
MSEESNELSFGVEQKYTKRPWYISIMAIWALFGIGGFSISLARYLSHGNRDVYQILGVVILSLTIVLMINIVKMKKPIIIAFGVLNIALGLWQSLNLINHIFNGRPHPSIIGFLLFIIIPSLIMAYLSLRPSFLFHSDKFSEYKNLLSMQKISLKKTH